MSRRPLRKHQTGRIALLALVGILLLGLSLGTPACSGPWSATPPSGADPAAAVNQAIYQLQAALGLPDGAISRSSQPPMLAGSEVALRWLGGRADVDLDTGRLRAVLVERSDRSLELTKKTEPVTTTSTTVEQSTTTTKVSKKRSKKTTTTSTTAAPSTTTTVTPLPTLPISRLDDEADRLLSLLGWDSATLETRGFRPSKSKTIDRGDTGPVFEKIWLGHDSEGVPNEGVIEVGLDALTGELRSFLFNPGPENGLDMSKIISEEEAVATAKEAAAKNLLTQITRDASVQPSTATTIAENKPTTTTTARMQVKEATMIHTNKPGITGGKDMLVWVVKLGGDGDSDKPGTTVYLDATDGTVLLVTAG